MNIAVIGGGVFGAMVAIDLAEAGQAVTIFERLPRLMQATSHNANRLHLGFHYPRDGETARQCARGYERFLSDFAEAILPGVTNAYFIASRGSQTSPESFLAFCGEQNLAYREIDPRRFRKGVARVDLGIVTEEVMYDATILDRLISLRLARSGVTVRLRSTVNDIAHGSDSRFTLSIAEGENFNFDGIVNCAYTNINRLNAYLGHKARQRQYEYTASPVVELSGNDVTVTIMDGPFFSLLPLGRGGDHLLFHVLHSVIAREDTPLLDSTWLDPATAPFASVSKKGWFEMIVGEASEYLPELRNARLKGFREGARMVLADAEDTDARPSIVTLREPGYVEVFSGKIVHCTWVGHEVKRVLGFPQPRRND